MVGKKGISPSPSLGMRFSPLRLSHRRRRHQPPLMNSYPSFKTHPQSAQPNQLVFSPPLLSAAVPQLPATLWAGNRPPASHLPWPRLPWLDHRLYKNREQTPCISVTSRTSCAVPSTWELLYEDELNN